MINIYRANNDKQPINFFHDRDWVEHDEVIIKTKNVYGQDYTYAEPAKPGWYAFGGTILFTSNGIYPEFNTPIKLHDRQMNLERG